MKRKFQRIIHIFGAKDLYVPQDIFLDWGELLFQNPVAALKLYFVLFLLQVRSRRSICRRPHRYALVKTESIFIQVRLISIRASIISFIRTWTRYICKHHHWSYNKNTNSAQNLAVIHIQPFFSYFSRTFSLM